MRGSILCCVAFFALALCVSAFRQRLLSDKASGSYPEKWFTQFVDHFDNENTDTWSQRYYINGDFYRPGGPIILYINGEGPVAGPPSTPDNMVVILAKQLNAVIVTLEHRYYGKSVPTEDMSTENLRFLSSKQALFDLALFAQAAKSWYNNAPLVSYGGSYSGALSAWFRLKFPHITRGSVSSSGVVNAILDFVGFDEQVAESAGQDCATALRATTAALEQALLADAPGTKALFNATNFYDGDFWYMMADSGAEGVQYGYQDLLCNPMLAAYHNNQSLVHAYADYVLNTWNPILNGNNTWTYSTQYQQDVVNSEEKNARQWWFQTCSELAYWQNAPDQGSIRSHFVNMTYHRDHCAAVFGSSIWPNTEVTNDYYGGADIAATNVVYLQGSQDPWQRAGVQHSLGPFQPEFTIVCHNCGHCVDLRGCPNGCADVDALQKGRDLISGLVKLWLAE